MSRWYHLADETHMMKSPMKYKIIGIHGETKSRAPTGRHHSTRPLRRSMRIAERGKKEKSKVKRRNLGIGNLTIASVCYRLHSSLSSQVPI